MRIAPWPFAIGTGLLWLVCALLQLRVGDAAIDDFDRLLQACGAAFGLGDPLAEGASQQIVELRLWRALCSGLVGGALALSGALLQGLFRNGLADPGVLGLNVGATLGASLAILALGGYAPGFVAELGGRVGSLSTLLITGFAFAGSLAAGVLVLAIATVGGRVSVPTLLLAGIAINATIAGLLAAIQSAVLADFEVQRALMSWTWGSLDDRRSLQVWIVGTGLLVSLALVPLVARELDLFAGGEEEAQALGVRVPLLKVLVLAGAALSSACAVAVAGQIAFIGLVVPHIVRLLCGTAHRRVLLLSVPAGALLLTGTDLAQRALLSDFELPPGVMMSLLGGPFFLFLLLSGRRRLEAW